MYPDRKINTLWRPTASIEAIKEKSRVLAQIRDFFASREVIEVDTPILSHYTVTDVHLHPVKARLQLQGKNHQGWLQTSPEFAMKRLLAAGVGDCYQIFKAFRSDETGRYHNPEFTLLEWYRLDFDHKQLMVEIDELLQQILDCPTAEYLEYQSLFVDYFKLDPLNTNCEQLHCCAEQYLGNVPEMQQQDDYLQMLFSMVIEKRIGLEKPCFVSGFPASQASLARLEPENPQLSRRFELYYKGVELANGFHELTDPNEHIQRFEIDNQIRADKGLPQVEIDHNFISALESGFPDCSGVALGIDRLLMIRMNAEHINQVQTFPFDRA